MITIDPSTFCVRQLAAYSLLAENPRSTSTEIHQKHIATARFHSYKTHIDMNHDKSFVRLKGIIQLTSTTHGTLEMRRGI